jgi:hypothetical protein
MEFFTVFHGAEAASHSVMEKFPNFKGRRII